MFKKPKNALPQIGTFTAPSSKVVRIPWQYLLLKVAPEVPC
jgi:hypothetical protein